MVNQEKSKVELALVILLLIVIIILFSIGVDSKCSSEQQQCNALASYYVWDGSNLTYISKLLSSSLSQIQIYNPQITNTDSVQRDSRVNVPFSCACIGELGFLGHKFVYEVQSEDTYILIAERNYASLTTVEMLQRFNGYDTNRIPVKAMVNVVVNCSCGNSRVSKDYGFFISYPLRLGQNLSAIAAEFNLSQQLLKDFNPNSDFSGGTGLVFIPGKDQNGTYPPFKSSSSSGITGGVIAGITVAGVAGAMLLAIGFYVGFYRRNKVVKGSLLREAFDRHAHGQGPESTLENPSKSGPLVGGVSLGLTGITVDKSVEFLYEELAKATDDFSLANKIGQGGFGSVYYAELRGEKAAIKKMDMQASKEFLAELKVLTHVHHLNLVRLIGYCVEGSLFLVYEFIENGNLSQHLRGLGRDPLPWSTRVQIALDSARGLEYIHEHTVPVYIHRDIKSANILIDKNFHAKVADFGLAKLTEVGSTSLHTRLVGTFGYMPPDLCLLLTSQK
ncbi:hypothetical protein CsSME_00031048 [Camellia sinensis var. sinensis]